MRAILVTILMLITPMVHADGLYDDYGDDFFEDGMTIFEMGDDRRVISRPGRPDITVQDLGDDISIINGEGGSMMCLDLGPITSCN
jgi:hypothetical protein